MPNCEIGGSGDELRAMMGVRGEERRSKVVRETRCGEGVLYKKQRSKLVRRVTTESDSSLF